MFRDRSGGRASGRTEQDDDVLQPFRCPRSHPSCGTEAHGSKSDRQEVPDLVAISTGSTFADSYTTLFARQNWLAGKTGVCNVEVQSAYLYGTHPTVARAYAVASVKSVTAAVPAYYLLKHGHSRPWMLPLLHKPSPV